MQVPNLLFKPKITVTALVGILTLTVPHIVLLIGAEPLIVSLFGEAIAQDIVALLHKTQDACDLLIIILGFVTAFGRSPAPVVDNATATSKGNSQ